MAEMYVRTCYMRRFFCSLPFSFLRCRVFVIIAVVEAYRRSSAKCSCMQTVILKTCSEVECYRSMGDGIVK